MGLFTTQTTCTVKKSEEDRAALTGPKKGVQHFRLDKDYRTVQRDIYDRSLLYKPNPNVTSSLILK